MKIRRLSEIDLARIAPLEAEEKRYRLRVLKGADRPTLTILFVPHSAIF